MGVAMVISAELSNPHTCLHVLKYKASLPVLLALCMPDCPRPTTAAWLERRVGYARDTVEKSLAYLADSLQLVFRRGRKRSSGWFLTDTVRQLPLPFVAMLPADATRPFPARLQDNYADHRPLTKSGRAKSPDHRPLDQTGSPTETGVMPKINALPHVVGSLINNHDLKDQILVGNDQQQNRTNAQTSGITADLLRWMSLDEPIPSRFADVDPAWPLACYWYATVCGFDNPAGYVRKRLENGHPAPRPWPGLAEAVLGLDDDQMVTLLEAGDTSRYSGLVSLPDDFPYIPYREFRQLYKATDGELLPNQPNDSAAEPETAVGTADPEPVGAQTAPPDRQEWQPTDADTAAVDELIVGMWRLYPGMQQILPAGTQTAWETDGTIRITIRNGHLAKLRPLLPRMSQFVSERVGRDVIVIASTG